MFDLVFSFENRKAYTHLDNEKYACGVIKAEQRPYIQARPNVLLSKYIFYNYYNFVI